MSRYGPAMRSLPVLLAALLVCAAVGAAVPLADPGGPPTAGEATSRPTAGAAVSVGTDADLGTRTGASAAAASTAANATAANTSQVARVLTLNGTGPTAAGVDVVTVDASTAVGFGANRSASQVATIALRERIAGAESPDERQKRILDGLNEVDKDVITLHTRQRRAIDSYVDGDITARQLLVELARVQAEAAVLTDRLQLLNRLADNTEDFTVDDSRIFPTLYDLETFGGPVRSRTLDALRGETESSTRVFVAADESGVVLSTVAGDEYVREAYRLDLRERAADINEGVAQNVTRRSYPEIWAAADGTVSGQGSGGTFLFDLAYPDGSLTAFVSGGTDRVFMEHQRMSLAGFPTGAAVTRTLDLTLRVNRTFPGGPLRVSVVDPSTGEPVNAVVKIGREGGESPEIGRTGDDGVLWTVSPRGEFVVTVVEVGSTDVSTVSVRPTNAYTVAAAFDAGTADGSETDGGSGGGDVNGSRDVDRSGDVNRSGDGDGSDGRRVG